MGWAPVLLQACLAFLGTAGIMKLATVPASSRQLQSALRWRSVNEGVARTGIVALSFVECALAFGGALVPGSFFPILGMLGLLLLVSLAIAKRYILRPGSCICFGSLLGQEGSAARWHDLAEIVAITVGAVGSAGEIYGGPAPLSLGSKLIGSVFGLLLVVLTEALVVVQDIRVGM